MKPTEKQLAEAPWMRTAIGYLGTNEIRGKTDNPVIVGFFAKSKNPQIKDDETAWCSAFANAVMYENGYEGTWNLMAKSWLRWKQGEAVTVPKYGDIVIFDRTSNPAFGHVAFFEGWDNQYVYVLGGNQGTPGGVTRTRYPRNRLRGFRRPIKKGTPKVPEMTQVDKSPVGPVEVVTGAGGIVGAAKPLADGDWVVGLLVLLTFAGIAGFLIWKRRRT